MSLFRFAMIFLIIGLVAGVFGFVGFGANAILAAKVAFLAWILKLFFFIFLNTGRGFLCEASFCSQEPAAVAVSWGERAQAAESNDSVGRKPIHCRDY